MRVPLSWLRTLVSLDVSDEDLAEQLTVAGIEVAAIEAIGVLDPSIVVGSVVSVDKIGDRDVHKLTVDVGFEVLLVSGAPNAATLAKGDKLAVALPGATMIDAKADTFTPIEVATRKVFGVKSGGAACSERELGISDDHSGVLVLNSDAERGTPLRELFQERAESWTADAVLALEILPNIARCQSMVGVARECSALTGGATLLKPAPAVSADASNLGSGDLGSGHLGCDIAEPERCPRFSSALLENVTITESPAWLKRHLVLMGQPPINNVVDATAYVMFELGQPMHAYDADKLASHKLGVRMSRSGDALHVLTQPDDAEPMKIEEGTMLITCADEPVAVAGVVGGTATSVTGTTKTVLLEAASFELFQIRRSQRIAKVFTESSARFSRGVDGQLTMPGIARALELIRETSPDAKLSALSDTVMSEAQRREVKLPLAEISGAIGVDYQLDEVLGALRRVGIDAESDGDTVIARVGSERSDITRPCDLMEEVARLVGFDRVPETLPDEAVPPHARNFGIIMRELARDTLVQTGLREIISYTLTSRQIERDLSMDEEPGDDARWLELLNPIHPDRSVTRRTLLGGLMECAKHNARFVDAIHIFEIGVVVHPERRDGDGLPHQPQQLSFIMSGPLERRSLHGASKREADIYDGFACVDALLHALHIDGVERAEAEHGSYQPGRCARLQRGASIYGHVGELHPTVAERFDLAGRRVVIAELDLDRLIADHQRAFAAKLPSRFPGIALDVSMFLAQSVTVGDVIATAQGAASELLESVEPYDMFTGEQVPDGMKALTLRLSFNAKTRSLETGEAVTIRDNVAAALSDKLSAQIRE